jgi:hypothetical protein
MTNDQQEKAWHTRRTLIAGLFCGVILIFLLLFLGFSWWKNNNSPVRLAPEAERVLSAQIGLPFQVLIPAYLPAHFIREKAEILLDQSGPHGEPMLQVVYPTPKGNKLVIQEWLPKDVDETAATECRCACASIMGGGEHRECNPSEVGISIGTLRVAIKLSAMNLITYEQLSLVLDTLGPATNQQVFTKITEMPVTYNMPPAVAVPINAEGVQEVTLVVTPDGYDPAHFAVKKGVPVRLIFRQLGQVGCGNELIFQYGGEHREGEEERFELILATPADKKVMEFTPKEAGDFRYNCPHLIYRGVMTVEE